MDPAAPEELDIPLDVVSTEDPPPIPLGVGPPALGVTVFGAVLVKLETDVVATGFAPLLADADADDAVDGNSNRHLTSFDALITAHLIWPQCRTFC